LGCFICTTSLCIHIISITKYSQSSSDASNSLDAPGQAPFDWFIIPEHWYDLFKAKRTEFRNSILTSPRYAIFEAKEGRVYGFLYSFFTFEFIPRIAQKRYTQFCDRYLHNIPDENGFSTDTF